MWMMGWEKKLHQQFSSRERERARVNRSVRDRQKTRGRETEQPHYRETDTRQSQWASPKTELVQTRLLRPQPGTPPQSQPFRAPGMCPLEVQTGQLSVENKLLPCFQALWQPNYNPRHTHTHTNTRPILNRTLHPTLSSAPPPLCSTVKVPRGKMEGGATVRALNARTFRLTISGGWLFYN